MNDSATPSASSTAAAQPQETVAPVPNRRPRVREVSSRFMSSLNTPGGGGGEHLKSPRHTSGGASTTPSPAHKPMLQKSKTDPHPPNLDTILRRSYSDSPLVLHNYNKVPPHSSKPRGASTKLLFKENKGEQQQETLQSDNNIVAVSQSQSRLTSVAKSFSSSSRPDTPIASTGDRIVPSRFRQNIHPTSVNNSISGSAAAKLLQSSGLSPSVRSNEDHSRNGSSSSTVQEEDEEGCSTKCPNSPTVGQNNLSRTWSNNSNLRSSMPETRLLLAERNSTNSSLGDSHLNTKLSSASPCSRSLNFPFMNSTAKMMGANLALPPPHPSVAKQGDAAKKGKKVFNHQEQVHSLKLLHNHYLQWSFANAKAQASLRAQTTDTEKKLYSLGVKISDLANVVERKRIELGLLRRIKTLTTIVENHMPYLEEWSASEEEHSTSLSGITHALVNSLVRLPVSGNVQVDIREVGDALNSAIKVLEAIYLHVQRFLPQANELDNLSSELARSVAGERVRIEECGDLLLNTYKLQVEDCSLRGHLMQLKNSNSQLCNNGDEHTSS